MSEDRQALLQWVDEERERIVAFFRAFIRCKSPNPPGDTTEAARFIGDFLRGEGSNSASSRPTTGCPTWSRPSTAPVPASISC